MERCVSLAVGEVDRGPGLHQQLDYVGLSGDDGQVKRRLQGYKHRLHLCCLSPQIVCVWCMVCTLRWFECRQGAGVHQHTQISTVFSTIHMLETELHTHTTHHTPHITHRTSHTHTTHHTPHTTHTCLMLLAMSRFM